MKFSPDLRQSFEHFACLLILPLVVLLSACGGSNNNDELSDTPSYLPSVSITSSTNMVQQFDDLTLSWTAAQADSCVASGDWSGDKTTTGTETLSPATAGTKDYTLTCEGAGGSTTQSVSVVVSAVSPEITLTPSAGIVEPFNTFTLSWTSEYTDSCVASGDWSGDKTTTGTETLSFPTEGTKTFSLTCEGAGGSLTSSVSVEIVPATIAGDVALEGVYLAQTHVAQPNNAYFNLTSNRPALLKVDLSSSNAGISPTVTAIVSNDDATETFTLQGPEKLPFPEEVTAEPGKVLHKMENSFTTVVPRELVQPSMALTLKVASETLYERDIEVGAPNAMSLNMFDVYYFNKTTNQSDYPPNTFNELLSKWPVSELSLQRVRNIVFEQLVIPARPGVGAPTVKVRSPAEYKTKTGLNFDGEQAAALQWVHALSAAGGNHDVAMMYINIIGVIAGGQAGAFDGVGYGGAHGILHHELGHAFGLPHWQADSAYPYRGYAHGIPGDTISWVTNEMKVNVGPVWGFDFSSMTFLPPVINPNGSHPSKARYAWDPMQGGGTGTQTYPFLLNHFSDYSVKKMQLYIEDKLAVARDGDYYHWNDVDKSYSRPVDAPIGVRYPIAMDQQIFSVMAATALADRDINMVYPPIGPYTGNLIHTFDPNVPSDRALANTLNYCPSDGCDFSLKVQQGDVVNWFMLSSSASQEDDPYESASLSTVAVNLLASKGDISEITLYHTPNANINGIDNFEQLANWNGLAAVDQCPANPNKNTAGVCGCDLIETDSDFDGIPDCIDLCPLDPIKEAPRECGCGQLEGTCAPEYRFEAEEAALSHAVTLTASIDKDYKGTGFIDYQNYGSWIKWDNVYAPSEGHYEVIFRYAAASSRPTNVLVNGSLEAVIGTVAGNGWNDWIEQSVSLKLKQGTNVIRVVAEDSTGVNLDYMSASGLTKSESLADGHDDSPITCASENNDNKLKVFILAGQSNMIGTGRVEHYVSSSNSSSGISQYPSSKQSNKYFHSFGEHMHWLSGIHACEIDTLVNQDIDFYETGKGKLRYLVNEINGRFNKLVDNQGDWRIRDDVWVESRGSKSYSGWLSPTMSNDNKFGPDFMFGNTVGDALNENVLIIKVAWGGKSLQTDFRPPSSGGDVGPSYTEMVEHIHLILNDIESLVPGYSIADGYELSGFGWHQGWNDGGSWEAVNEYAVNLTNLINDIRSELNSPELPFVIASSGFGGINGEVDRREALMAIQEEVTQYPEFVDNTGFVDTRPFWRDPYESPSDQVYHWNLNAETYYLIGKEMGRSIIDLACQP